MSRLRPLTEAECYTRLYGDRESAVSVIREGEEAPAQESGLPAEHLHRLFGAPDERPTDLPDAEAA